MPTPNSRISSKHFHDDEFTLESTDSNPNRKQTVQIKKRRLKKSAVPALYPDLPIYFSRAKSIERSGKATQAGRMDTEQDYFDEMAVKLFQDDSFDSFQSLKENIS